MPNEKMIRPATNADEVEVTSLVFHVLREYDLEPDPERTDADLKDIEGSYAERGGCFDVLLDDGGSIVGSVGLFPLSRDTCELRKMYVHHAERGKGYGKMLLEHVLGRAAEMGFTHIVLETASVLKEAIDLYRQYGFVPYEPPHLSARCDHAFIKTLPNKMPPSKTWQIDSHQPPC